MRDFMDNEVKFYDLNNIYFGNNVTDLNLCKPQMNFYRIKNDEEVPDLDTPNVTIKLES